MRMKLLKWGPVLLVAAVSTVAFGEPPADPRATEAARAVAGSELTLTPALPFESALLRVVGPKGYVARKTYTAGAVMVLDLLREGRVPALDDRGEEVGTLPPAALADGRYRYEAVLGRPPGSRRVHGSLVARGGSLQASPVAFEEARDTAAERPDVGLAPLPASLVVDELLDITDTNNNGLTWVRLEANDSSGSTLEKWQIQNKDGDLHIVEDGDGSQNEVRLAILQDGFDRRMGIGTTTPASLLHLVGGVIRVEDDDPRLILIDQDDPLGDSWHVGQNINSGLVIGKNRCCVNPFAIAPDATNQLLVLRGNSVHISGDLSISSNATVEGDLSVLSSRDAKEDFAPVEADEVLARLARLPIREWSYKDSSARHLGPVAEEFYAAFALGSSERTVNPLDLSGVALTAIQALQARQEEERTAAAARLADRDRQIALLGGRLDDLGRRLAQLEGEP